MPPSKPTINIEELEHQKLGNDWHPKKEVLRLACYILLALFILYCLSIVTYSWGCNPAGKEIFEAAQKILPPIATLVIGYYFARKNK
jgi:hypothetical protein